MIMLTHMYSYSLKGHLHFVCIEHLYLGKCVCFETRLLAY